MRTYLVGGAVRDNLMGQASKDLDYVVTGATPQDMLDHGYQQVGADFPVFLHPETGDEYALARKEKSTGSGYNDFSVDFDPDVSLEDDLSRRDFTMNAVAMDEDGNYVDPFGGQTDIKKQTFRHVTDQGFVEDPVRVLRWARFNARHNGWVTAFSTKQLMKRMVAQGMLTGLTKERVWKEFSRAIMENHPVNFFRALDEVEALEPLFPEIHLLKRATENPKWHPEGDAFEHTMLVLEQAVKQGGGFEERMAALVHDVGKGMTPEHELPKHYGHDTNGAILVKDMGKEYCFPSDLTKKLSLVTRYHMNMHRLDKLNPKTFVKMFDDMGAKHSDETVMLLYNLGKYDARGRLGSHNEDVSDKDLLLTALKGYVKVKGEDVLPKDKDISGQHAQQLMYAAHRKAVASALKG